jgi:hypothetical protein
LQIAKNRRYTNIRETHRWPHHEDDAQTRSVLNRVLNSFPISATATLLAARTSCMCSGGPHMATTWTTG